jgi:hypothetical protein
LVVAAAAGAAAAAAVGAAAGSSSLGVSALAGEVMPFAIETRRKLIRLMNATEPTTNVPT